MGCSFIIHGPAASYKLQLAIIDKSFDLMFNVIVLVDPPFPKERRLHINKSSVGVFFEFVNNRIDNVLNAGILDGIVGTVVVFVYGF
mgnify:CR=1 FL=1